MKQDRMLKIAIEYIATGNLKPCPYCGGMIEYFVLDMGRKSHNFQCKGCKKIIHIDGGPSK